MRTGIVGLPAPQLRDVRWIDGSGEERGPLSLDDLGDGYRILYLFQGRMGMEEMAKMLDRVLSRVADRPTGGD